MYSVVIISFLIIYVVSSDDRPKYERCFNNERNAKDCCGSSYDDLSSTETKTFCCEHCFGSSIPTSEG